jgi:hypothetical protein
LAHWSAAKTAAWGADDPATASSRSSWQAKHVSSIGRFRAYPNSDAWGSWQTVHPSEAGLCTNGALAIAIVVSA